MPSTFTKTKIDGVYVLTTKRFKDKRGYFAETYNEKEFSEKGIPNTFIQDNESESSYGVIRGLHMQLPPYDQAKLVRVVSGRVLDVAVDVRPESKTFGEHVAVVLSKRNGKQLFIPRGFLHGFAVLSKKATFVYKVDNIYKPDSEFGIRYDDPQINIKWPISQEQIITSPKDNMANTLADLKKKLLEISEKQKSIIKEKIK